MKSSKGAGLIDVEFCHLPVGISSKGSDELLADFGDSASLTLDGEAIGLEIGDRYLFSAASTPHGIDFGELDFQLGYGIGVAPIETALQAFHATGKVEDTLARHPSLKRTIRKWKSHDVEATFPNGRGSLRELAPGILQLFYQRKSIGKGSEPRIRHVSSLFLENYGVVFNCSLTLSGDYCEEAREFGEGLAVLIDSKLSENMMGVNHSTLELMLDRRKDLLGSAELPRWVSSGGDRESTPTNESLSSNSINLSHLPRKLEQEKDQKRGGAIVAREWVKRITLLFLGVIVAGMLLRQFRRG